MSIKNPYDTKWLTEHHEIYNSDGYAGECFPYQGQYDAFNEGVKASNKWWIERVGEDIVEVFLNLPMNESNKETLLKTWQFLKQSSEIKMSDHLLIDSWCDSTCELYDGRMCDVASNCNRRQLWKKSLEIK